MDEMFLPPFVVNDHNVILTQSQSTSWGFDRLQMMRLHEAGLTGKGIRVAVIDTGVEITHSDLEGQILKSFNTSGEPDSSTFGHGTNVAGIIAARNDTNGVVGYAPDSALVVIKAMKESGGGSYASIINAIEVAIEAGVHIINMSLGGTVKSNELENAVLKAISMGIDVVAAAGNAGRDDSIMYPGRYGPVFCVGASNKQNQVSAFSSRGWDVDIAAPGERILTTAVGNSYATVTGSSFASPAIAGILACLRQGGIRVTHDMLKETSIDIDSEGRDVKSGWGLIDPVKLMNYTSIRVNGEDIDFSLVKDALFSLNKFLRDNNQMI